MSDKRPTLPVMKPASEITAEDMDEWPELEISAPAPEGEVEDE